MKNLKRFFAALLVMCVLFTLFQTVVVADGDVTFTSADGVTVDGTTYTLTKDITVNATNAALSGVTINGNGYTITTSVPIFASLDGTVQNLKIAGTVEGSVKIYGVLANEVTGTLSLTNVVNNATITDTTTEDNANVGGFIGKSTYNITFTNCINNGNVTANTENLSSGHRGYVGGFIGYTEADTTFRFCTNKGKIKGNAMTGGFIGYANKADKTQTFTNCANLGDISTQYNRSESTYLVACLAGGFIGGLNQENMTISGCYNAGNIQATSSRGNRPAYASAFLSISGVVYKNPNINNSYSGGTETVTLSNGATGYASSVMGEYSYNTTWTGVKKANCQNKVYVKADGNDPFNSVDANGFVVALADYNADNKYTAGNLADGTLKNNLNTAFGSNAFEQRVGKDAKPWLWAEYSNTSIADYWAKDETTYTLDENDDIIVGLTYSECFTGTLNGNGATVYTTVPLFAEVAATIQNLTIEGSIVDSDTTGGGNGVAALTKTVTGDTTLENVTNNVSVQSTIASPNQLAVGGLIGVAKQNNLNLTLIDCVNNGTISATGSTSGGGSGRVYVGGFVGMIDKVSGSPAGGTNYFYHCVNNGNVSSNSVSGGFVGRTTVETGNMIRIERSVNAGDVTTSNDGKMGAAYNYCCAGGFVGVNANKRIKITDSFNVGNVSATATGTNASTSKATAAGLCNLYNVDNNILVADSEIRGNYSLGTVTATAPSGEAAYAGLLISDHYKGTTWNSTKAAVIGDNYVLTIDASKNGQDIFNTYNGSDATEAEVIDNATDSVKTVAFEMAYEASIRLDQSGGIRFKSTVSKDMIEAIETVFGTTYDENYEIGTMLWKTADGSSLEQYTQAALSAAGVTFTKAKRTNAFNDNELNGEGTKYIIRGSLVGIAAAYREVYISARAYIKLGNLYIYADVEDDNPPSTCLKDIATLAYREGGHSAENMSLLETYGATPED